MDFIKNHIPKLFLASIFIFLISCFVLYASYMNRNSSAAIQEITLTECYIAFSPETSKIIALDRKTNNVVVVFSKEATTSVFSLKAMSIQQDYLDATNQGGKTNAGSQKVAK